MKFKKADWTIVREAESAGLMVGMTSTVERIKTPLNEELGNYFRKQLPSYTGSYDEYDGEDVLDAINEYLIENNYDRMPLGFPMTSGTDIVLIPITENLQLKLIIVDEYYGGGDYAKYVLMDFFMINEKTTTEDVDELIDRVRYSFHRT